MTEPVLDMGEVGGVLPVGVEQLMLWQNCGVWLLLSVFSIKGCIWVRFPLLLCPTRPVVSRKEYNLRCCIRPVLMSQGLAVTLDSEVTAAHCCGTAHSYAVPHPEQQYVFWGVYKRMPRSWEHSMLRELEPMFLSHTGIHTVCWCLQKQSDKGPGWAVGHPTFAGTSTIVTGQVIRG